MLLTVTCQYPIICSQMYNSKLTIFYISSSFQPLLTQEILVGKVSFIFYLFKAHMCINMLNMISDRILNK